MNQPELNTVCLTFDFDAMSVWLGGYPHVTPAMLSRGGFGARVGVPHILELLRRFDIRAIFFTPGHTAESFPEAVTTTLETGHKVVYHGYGHEDSSIQTPAEERASLERGLAALEKLTGQRPRGYRSPSSCPATAEGFMPNCTSCSFVALLTKTSQRGLPCC